MSADINPQGFLFHRKLLLRRKFPNGRQFIRLLKAFVTAHVKQVQLSFYIILSGMSDSCKYLFINRHVLTAETAEAVQCAALNQSFNAAHAPFSALHAVAEIRQRGEFTVFFALRNQCIHRTLADILDCRQRKANLPIGYGKLPISFVDIGGQKLNPHFLTFLDIAADLRRIVHHACHQCRHEFHGIMRLQPSSLIANHRIAGSMAFIKGIFCKVRHFIKNLFCRFYGNPVFHTAGHLVPIPIDKFFPFLCHHGCLFLAHRTAHQVTSAQTVACQIPHNLHYLLLIHDTAVGVFQNRLQLRMGILHLAACIFPLDIFRDKIHRPGAIKRNPRNHILQAAWLQLSHKLLHAAAFQLEHALCFALANHVIHHRIIFGQLLHV